MPVFVQLWSTVSVKGVFDWKKDTKQLNDILSKLQEKGAKIIDVKATMGMKEGGVHASITYVILYEAPRPIEV
ncbi:MAG: hypothetical protein DRN03_06135 [Thermoplasmata archaeon]|nr:MAG: hypothetical protein DRN03_06135 [Thermoplasmata archaeon]